MIQFTKPVWKIHTHIGLDSLTQ